MHSHPTMCDAYFYCNNGTQSADQFCPEGLLFNGETCDYSHNVDCEAECEYGKGIIPFPLNLSGLIVLWLTDFYFRWRTPGLAWR